MIDPVLIAKSKAVLIVDYLHSIGCQPAKQLGSELYYCSPKTGEKTPSLAVHPVHNVFRDFSGDGRGDVISLVRYLTGCSFTEAIETLSRITPERTPSFSFNGNSKDSGGGGVVITDVRPLTHPVLLSYCQKRGIPADLSRRYLVEIHYQNKDRSYYAVGFPNDTGGYEMRNPYYKGCIGAKSITTLNPSDRGVVCVFEGFFDFLSALVHFKTGKPSYTVIVLNTLSLLPRITPSLSVFGGIRLYLDNDRSGAGAVAIIKQVHKQAVDCSYIYADYKDFNEYLKATSSLQP